MKNDWYKSLRKNAIVEKTVKNHVGHIKITDKDTGEIRYERWTVHYNSEILKTRLVFTTEEEAIEFNNRCKEYICKQRLSNGIKVKDLKDYPINLIKSIGIDEEKEDIVEVVKNFEDNYNKVCEELLTPRERRILQARFEEYKTLEKIAEEIGVTRERVRQIEGKALGKLKLRKNIFLNKRYNIIKSEIYEQLKAEAIAEVKQLKERLTVQAAYEIIKEYETANGKYCLPTEIDNVSIRDLGLSNRTTNSLLRTHYRIFKDIKGLTEEELMKIRNLGKKSIKELIDFRNRYLSA